MSLYNRENKACYFEGTRTNAQILWELLNLLSFLSVVMFSQSGFSCLSPQSNE